MAAVRPMRVLLFDVFGTLVDWRSSLIDIAVTAGARLRRRYVTATLSNGHVALLAKVLGC
jgi:hypothetical protein